MENKNCWMCGKEIDLDDKYCRHCGKKQDKGAQFPYTLTCAFLLFFVIGPLCLVNVWKSPLMKRDVKIIFSIIVAMISYMALVLMKNMLTGYMNMLNINM